MAMRKYNRCFNVPRVMPVWPWEMRTDLISRSKLVHRLEIATRAEHQRGLEGHPLYCPARLTGLRICLKEEKKQLRQRWEEDHCL